MEKHCGLEVGDIISYRHLLSAEVLYLYPEDDDKVCIKCLFNGESYQATAKSCFFKYDAVFKNLGIAQGFIDEVDALTKHHIWGLSLEILQGEEVTVSFDIFTKHHLNSVKLIRENYL